MNLTGRPLKHRIQQDRLIAVEVIDRQLKVIDLMYSLSKLTFQSGRLLSTQRQRFNLRLSARKFVIQL